MNKEHTVETEIIRLIAERLGVETADPFDIHSGIMTIKRHERHRFYFFHLWKSISMSHSFDTHYSKWRGSSGSHIFTFHEDRGEVVFAIHKNGKIPENIEEELFVVDIRNPNWLDDLENKFYSYLIEEIPRIEQTSPRRDLEKPKQKTYRYYVPRRRRRRYAEYKASYWPNPY